MDGHSSVIDEPPDRRGQSNPRPEDPAEQGYAGDRDQPSSVPETPPPGGNDERQSDR